MHSGAEVFFPPVLVLRGDIIRLLAILVLTISFGRNQIS